jgi:hypothetical protein
MKHRLDAIDNPPGGMSNHPIQKLTMTLTLMR